MGRFNAIICYIGSNKTEMFMKKANSVRNLHLIMTILLVGLVAHTVGCTGSQATPRQITATPAPVTNIPTIAPTVTPGPVIWINPLTGLPVDDPTVPLRRPLAIKISNAPAIVRPQAGISAADLVFEHYVEGSYTRFTAIFWTHSPPRAGSVRSARLLDLELPAMYDALFAYSGASEGVRQRIAELPFAPRAYEGVTTGEPLYFRDPGIEAPHNLFVVPDEVWARAAADDPTPPALDGGWMVFDPVPPAAGRAATRLRIDYGPDLVQWDYDAETGQYRRTVNDEPHRDANNGTQVTADNVVLIYAHHQEDLSIVESEWQGEKDFSIEIQIWTLGPVVVVRDGQAYDGYWQRWEEEAMLSFWVDEAATTMIPLKPGNTWFQVVPLDFTEARIE